MRNISDFYRPQDSGKQYRRKRGGGKIALVVAVVLLLGAGWLWPQQSGRLVGKTIQATANVWDSIVHREQKDSTQDIPDLEATPGSSAADRKRRYGVTGLRCSRTEFCSSR